MILSKFLPLFSAVGVLMINAANVPSDCIERGSYFGNNPLSDLSTFEHTKILADNLPVHYTPSGYELCVDTENENKLISFSVIYANENESEKWQLPKMGPKGGECTEVSAPVREFPRAFRIYQDGKGINAV